MNTKLSRVLEEKPEFAEKKPAFAGIYKKAARLIASKEYSLAEVAKLAGINENKLRAKMVEDIEYSKYINALEIDYWSEFKQVRAKRMKKIVVTGLDELERRMGTDEIQKEKLADITRTVYTTLDAMRQDLLPDANLNKPIENEMQKLSPVNILNIIMNQSKPGEKIIEVQDE